MKTLRHLSVPTGAILIVEGDRGPLECLSLGDYGKEVNIKCDAMGLTRDPGYVRHTTLLPLSTKWVITISTQYGCSMGCRFCDAPRAGPGSNATEADLTNQVLVAMALHPDVDHGKRLNLHYARMGEPTFNAGVLTATNQIASYLGERFGFHPVVSTMMPSSNRKLGPFLEAWLQLKNDRNGEAGLQLSINSTSDRERELMFCGNSLPLSEIAALMRSIGIVPLGRKITLNFAVAGYEIDAQKLHDLFDPEHYLVKLTPMHHTRAALQNKIGTGDDLTTMAPYRDAEEALKAEGFDVLVFIASDEEDLGRITCGNAILSGTLPRTPYIERVQS